jgi:hypothetical protein
MNLSENFVKSIAIDADQVYNNRNAKTGRNMQRINPGAGLPDTAFKLYHWLEHALEFMGINSTPDFANIDQYGYKYNQTFKTFDSEFYQFMGPITLEGSGRYYRDTNTGNYFEDFFFNLNIPEFGGDGSSLVPAYITSIYDGNNYLNFFIAGGEIEMIVEEATGIIGQFASQSISNDNIFSRVTNNSIDSQLQISDGGVTMSYVDYTYFKSTALALSNGEFYIKSVDSVNDVFTGLSSTDISNIKTLSLFGNNTAQSYNASINLITDYANTTQPVKINISGLKTYVDLAAATTDGLTAGDLFIVGNVLNIVP